MFVSSEHFIYRGPSMNESNKIYFISLDKCIIIDTFFGKGKFNASMNDYKSFWKKSKLYFILNIIFNKTSFNLIKCYGNY